MSNQTFKPGDRIVMMEPEGSFDAPTGSLGTVTAADPSRVTIAWDNPDAANFAYPCQIAHAPDAQAPAPEPVTAPTVTDAPAAASTFKPGDRVVMMRRGMWDVPNGAQGTVRTERHDGNPVVTWDSATGANWVTPYQVAHAPTPAPFKLPHADLTNACVTMINAATALREAQAGFDRARDALAAMFPRE